MLWAVGPEYSQRFPRLASTLMAPEDPQPPKPNLPLVPVRGTTEYDAMRLFERYNLPFAPPSYTELKLCEIIIQLEEMVEDLGTRR